MDPPGSLLPRALGVERDEAGDDLLVLQRGGGPAIGVGHGGIELAVQFDTQIARQKAARSNGARIRAISCWSLPTVAAIFGNEGRAAAIDTAR